MVGLALWVEVTWTPPLWLHALLWGPLTLGGALAMLRPLKGVMVAQTYRHRAETFEDGPAGDHGTAGDRKSTADDHGARG